MGNGHQTCSLCLGLNPHNQNQNQKRVNLGKIPRLIITSMGGFRSLLRIFLADCVAYRRHLQFLLQNQSIQKQQQEDQPEAACNHLGSEFHSVFPQLRAAETACSPAGGWKGKISRIHIKLGLWSCEHKIPNFYTADLSARSSSGPTFLLFDSMSSFLFFRNSIDT